MTVFTRPRATLPFSSTLILLVALQLFIGIPVHAAVIRVPDDAPTIQGAINVAQNGDTVLVADGTYSHHGNRDIDFLGKSITVRSENGPQGCIIDLLDGEFRAFDLFRGEGPGAVIEGFTITNGSIGVDWESHGGGIRLRGSSPIVRGNRIVNNYAGRGGGLACLEGANPLIENNYFANNRSIRAGGGIYSDSSSPVICENQVMGNRDGEDGEGGYGGGILCGDHTLVENNVISGNSARSPDGTPWPSYGGGIYAKDSATVSGNLVSNNSASVGGGIYCSGTNLITGNIVENTFDGSYRPSSAIAAGDAFVSGTSESMVTHNIVRDNGGIGIECNGANLLANNLVYENADSGIFCKGETTVTSCTIADNASFGLECTYGTTITVTDSIFWRNNGAGGLQIMVGGSGSFPSELSISYSDVEGGEAGLEYDPGYVTINWGSGMIDAPPLFFTGALSDYFLGQTAAGQAADSPCVDAGSGQAGDIYVSSVDADLCMDQMTTRIDLVPDQDVVDMGFHHLAPPEEPDTFIREGPSGTVDSPVLNFTFTGSDNHDLPEMLSYSHRLDEGVWSEYSQATLASFSSVPEGDHIFAVRARDSEGNVDPSPALRPFTQELWDDSSYWRSIVTGPGPGPINPPLVRTAQGQWLAYTVVGYGVNVAAGDIDGDGIDEVITGPGPGQAYGPHVRCFEPDGQVVDGAGVMAYGTHNYGVNVAAGDIDGDGFDEIVTGAGPGAVFGPHVRGWNRDGGPETLPIPGVSFFAYGTLKWGVNVTCGDIDGDGIDEIVTGAGPGPEFGPHVRGWNWDGTGTVAPIPEVSFMAYSTSRYGVNVACGDVDEDGFDEIITGAGPSPAFGSHVLGFNWDGSGDVALLPGFNYMAYSDSKCGVVVASGKVDGDGRDDVVTAPGPGPDNYARVFANEYRDEWIYFVAQFHAYDWWMNYGGRVAVGNFY